ncbi:MAG: CapA family protein [Clostridiales bacterium]|jgi:poly-gamma-glutamate synthesis protein (capsule biosynthesis protein)|nr:CapA family protein [Clostridiales bacterium]
MTKRKPPSVFLFVIPCCLLILLASGRVSAKTAAAFTDEYLRFLAARETERSAPLRDSADGYQFLLENGRLSIVGTDYADNPGDPDDPGDTEVWRSKDEWYVDSFRLCDVNRDRILDVVFVVWKSYSFGAEYPARMANEDAAVRCHLFVYSIKDNRVKPLWCSSNLPRPIYSFELNMDGERTPTLSGALLATCEGAYTDDYRTTVSSGYTYEWNGWGFSPATAPPLQPPDDSPPADSLSVSDVAERSATLAVVGDLMCHEAQNQAALLRGGGTAYDFDNAFSHIAPYISAADYAIGNLETTMVLPGNRPSGFPAFGSPSSFAQAIKTAGFDLVTTANNHALDFGKEGLAHTLQVLDDLGLEHTGTYAAEADSQKITVIDVNGITFAVLSYTYSTNGIAAPRGSPWCVNRADHIMSDIARAKALNADMIIVLPHMGMEYETTTRRIFKDEVHELLRAGADIVLASHPHVLQPVEFVDVADANGETRHCFAAYSLGNFISSQRKKPRDSGVILNLTFTKRDDGATVLEKVSYVPTWVQFVNKSGQFDITVLPVADVLNDTGGERYGNLRTADITRMHAVLSETGNTLLGRSARAALTPPPR